MVRALVAILSLTDVAKAHRISRAMVSKIVAQSCRPPASHEGSVPAPSQVQENKQPETAA